MADCRRINIGCSLSGLDAGCAGHILVLVPLRLETTPIIRIPKASGYDVQPRMHQVTNDMIPVPSRLIIAMQDPPAWGRPCIFQCFGCAPTAQADVRNQHGEQKATGSPSSRPPQPHWPLVVLVSGSGV